MISRIIYTALALVFLAPAAIPLTAAVLPEDQPRIVAFEARLASFDEVEGWKVVPGPKPDRTIWISPETTLTNADVTKAWYEPRDDEHTIGLLLTEDGALELARTTKMHIGEPMALMIDGRVTSAPIIMAPILGGRASIHGNFTEEEARVIAEGIVGE